MALKFKIPFGPGLGSSKSMEKKFKREKREDEDGFKRLKRQKQLRTPGQKTRRT